MVTRYFREGHLVGVKASLPGTQGVLFGEGTEKWGIQAGMWVKRSCFLLSNVGDATACYDLIGRTQLRGP